MEDGIDNADEECDGKKECGEGEEGEGELPHPLNTPMLFPWSEVGECGEYSTWGSAEEEDADKDATPYEEAEEDEYIHDKRGLSSRSFINAWCV